MPNRVAECGEVQRVRRGSSRVICQPSLRAIDHEPALGQPDRSTGATGFDRRLEVVHSHIDRLADAGAVQTQARKVSVELADAREEPLQHVPLNLPCGVADDLTLLAGKPLGALLANVFVVGNAENVRAAEGVRGLVARCPGSRWPADGRVVRRCRPDAETCCGADSYQRRNPCE